MRTLAAFLLLGTLALPPASALGEELADTLPPLPVEVEALLTSAEAFLLAPPEPRGERAADERERAAHSEPAPERASEPTAAPAHPATQQSLLNSPVVAPVTRLLPIPVTNLVGAAPRLDLSAVSGADLAPRAPAPMRAAPASAPAAAPAPEAIAAAAPAASVMALGVAATASVAAPAAGVLWERLRRVGLLALLYSRIAKERLLDHGTRERLLDAIRAQPGLAVADLADRAHIPRNTITYHLRVLEREGLISSTRQGRNRLYFAPGSLPQRASADAIATLRHETTLAVARKIGAQPGVDQKAICGALGLSPSLAHWHADRLVSSGVVDKRREGRFVRYYPGASFDYVTARAA